MLNLKRGKGFQKSAANPLLKTLLEGRKIRAVYFRSLYSRAEKSVLSNWRVKELLKRALGKAILTYEELLTVLCDCEAVVNSRPLTYGSEDPNDLIPLTPSLFLNGKSSYDTIDLDLSEFSKFQKRIRYRRKLIHNFRSRFRKEYLGQLRQKRPGKPGYDFKVGDIMTIEEPSKKLVYAFRGK
ncbi:integrase catalytic domain-containing protein [Trichonephila clavipes]|nr:integrase catalytic domain-containing protein [Trichonephila clavipes]